MFKSATLIVAAQISKILVGLVLIKLSAVYVGIEGFGRLGNLMSFVTILTMLAGGGIVNGLIKYTSEYRKNVREVLDFVAASSIYSLYISVIIFLALNLFAQDIAQMLFSVEGFDWVIRLLSVTQICIAFSNLVTGVANGYKNTKVFATVQVVGNIASMIVIWLLISTFGLMGAAFSVAMSYALMVVPAFFFFYRSRFWGRVRLVAKVQGPHFKRLFGFTLMLLVSASTFPVTEIFIRGMIIENSGFIDAGLWQALIKLSSVYIGFFGLFLAYYFIPTISPLRNVAEIRNITCKYFFIVASVFSVGSLLLVVTSNIVLPLLLSDEFVVLAPLLKYQLIGDFFKILAFVIGFVFVAKAKVKVYILAELFQNGLFAVLAFIFYADSYDLVSIMNAYMVAYVVYFLVSLLVFSYFLQKDRLINGV